MAHSESSSDSVREQRRLGFYTGQYEMRLEELDRRGLTHDLCLEDFGVSDFEQAEMGGW